MYLLKYIIKNDIKTSWDILLNSWFDLIFEKFQRTIFELQCLIVKTRGTDTSPPYVGSASLRHTHVANSEQATSPPLATVNSYDGG